MAKRTTNLVLWASRVVEAKQLLAEAGFSPIREETIGEDKVRLYFRETEAAECLRLFKSVPSDMHAYRILG